MAKRSHADAGEKIINACRPAGIKPREFLIVTAGDIKEYPSSIPPENAAFVEKNYDKLQTMPAPLSGDGK